MSTKKKQIPFEDGMTLYGVGQKSIVKYLLAYIPEKDAYKISIIGGKGRASSFTVKEKHFTQGETLYKHGYRMYSYSEKLEHKYVSYLVKHSLYIKLQKISLIIERANRMTIEKMVALSKICDTMIDQSSEIDRRIKKNISRIK